MIRRLSQHLVFRYLLAGGTSAFVDLAILYVLNSIWGVYYLLAATLAFCVAFFVSFGLHKFWTFRDHSRTRTHVQAAMYLGTSLFGLGLNTFLMYLFVDHAGLPVMVAQVIVGGLVACCTFFLSRHIVFKQDRNLSLK
jgi:putative flippase GtrA